jgi:hypothetical protein
MAQFKVTDPETGKSYIVDAAENATPEQLTALAKQQASPSQGVTQQPTLSARDIALGTARNFMQGVTLGGGDELEALIAKGLDVAGVPSSITGAPSGYTVEQYRQMLENQRLGVSQQFPALSAGAELAGAIPAAITTAGMAMPVQGARVAAAPASIALGEQVATKTAPSLGRQTATGAGIGGLLGGVTAFNKGEGDVGQRSMDATTGAALGTLFGGAAPLVMAAGGKGLDFVKTLWRGGQTPEAVSNKANQLILQSLARDEVNLGQAASRAQQLEKKGVPDVMLPEVAGRATTQRLSAAANYPGGGIDKTADQLTKNVQQQSILLPQYFSEAAGIPRVNSTAVIDDILAKRKATAGPLYKRAYAVDAEGKILRYVNNPEINKLLKLPQFKKAADSATELLQAEGVIPVGAKVDLTPTVQNLDNIKRGLDDLINKQTDSVTGKVSQLGAVYINTKKQFLDAIDAAVPEYKAARAVYAGDTEAANSVKLGRRIVEAGEDEWRGIQKQFQAMSPSNRALSAYGALDELGIQIERAGQAYGGKAPDVTRFATGIQNAKRLESFIPSKQDRVLFRERVSALQEKAQVRNAVLSGSRTAPMAAEMQDMAGGPTSGVLSSLAAGNPTPGVTQKIAEWIQNRREGVTEQVAKDMASKLTLSGPALQDYLASLIPYQRKLFMDARRQAGIRATASGVGGYSGGALPTINKRPSSGPTTRGGARGLLN